MTRPVIQLPFSGFYYSIWDDSLDHELEQASDWRAEQEGESLPPELRLTAAEFNEAAFWAADFSASRFYIARHYVKAFDHEASRLFNFPLRLAFENLSSPREYNFTTDRIFAFTTHKAVKAMFAMSRADKHESLERLIEERFTSRDGFSSFYSNALGAWLEKPLRDWDHNELGTLLLACLDISGADPDSLENEIWEHASGNGVLSTALDESLGERYEKRIEEIRAEKLEEQKQRDPDYVPPPERCPFTLDLFA